VNKAFAALAAGLLTLVLLSPGAEARCWSNGYRWHCTHHRYHHAWRYRYYRPYYPPVYPAYYPYAYQPYYRPAYFCFPFWPFCG